MTVKGRISELFFSFQGEGLYLGEPQIFIRLAGCNISPGCAYCDTALEKLKEMTPEEVLARIEREKWPTKFISLTGGEPLLQAEFLHNLLAPLKKRKFKTYLETNGTLPGALAAVIDRVDIIAMDIKLPSSGRTRPFWDKHRQFLRLGKKKEIMIKVVVTGETEESDLARAISLVKEEAPSLPFILQPVTPIDKSSSAGSKLRERAAISTGRTYGGIKAIGEKKLQDFFGLCRQHLKNVLVIPQVHAILGLK